ncbi:hypothetical protein [Chondrinema litorale]|uniref:hypothetical protein n=1 Tax=Chondrinema litorale TaxID=2994555 RepID=UPI00254358F6|nr:hypothetical protein [Chondrinema litorale]UZS00240.1 hypothetical protein OQ292_40580 [Chondrinema litorale]
MKDVKGKHLLFISRIKRDGSGTTEIDEDQVNALRDESFSMSRLSIKQDTWIASGFNSYVVKLPKKDFFEEEIREPIQGVLMSLKGMTTNQCDDITDAIIQDLRSAGFEIIKVKS